MGSPLGAVLACAFLEFLESVSFRNILLQKCSYFRYIGDILKIYPHETILSDLANRFNSIEHFTFEAENDNALHFLDIMLHRTSLQRMVYITSNNKNGVMKYYSHHCSRIKPGIIYRILLVKENGIKKATYRNTYGTLIRNRR